MLVDGRFVRQNHGFVGAVGHPHHVDVAELRAALTPVGVGHDEMSAHLFSGGFFEPRRNGPVEQRIELGDPLTGDQRFDVLEEGAESPDDLPSGEFLGDCVEFVQRQAGFAGAGSP